MEDCVLHCPAFVIWEDGLRADGGSLFRRDGCLVETGRWLRRCSILPHSRLTELTSWYAGPRREDRIKSSSFIGSSLTQEVQYL